MNSTRLQSNTIERVYFTLLDADGLHVTGLTDGQLNMLVLMRKSDGKYYDGDSWESDKTALAVTEQDAINSPGLYYYDTPTLAEGVYYIRVDTDNAENDPLEGEIKVGDYIDDIELTKRLLDNKFTIDEGNSKLRLWNDAGDTVIREWDLTDKDGSTIVLHGTSPANRGTPTTP